MKRPGEAWAPWEMYGYLQISISVENGRIIEVRLDRFPDSSRGSNERSLQLLPRLIDDLMSAQTEQLNYGGLTGATYTVEAWKSALHELFVKAGL